MAGEAPRASGPFINPDHFANYLSLIFPMALACALFRTLLRSRTKEGAFRILSGLAALLLFSGILLSLSRSGWMSALLGVSVLLWVSPWHLQERMPSVLKRRAALAVRFSLVILCLLLILSLFFVGPGGRKQVDSRLQETVMQDTGLGGRVSIWKDALGMIRDFPLLGVGLGSWPDLFPHYQTPPWSSGLYREAHNDYLELLSETGIIGFGFLAWFFYRCAKILFRSPRLLSRKVLPLFAALLSALGVMAFHEFFDFNLQIPANAFLFTLFFALALRMTMSAASSQPSNLPASRSSSPRVFVPAAIAVVAFALLVFSLNQEIVPYPYNLKEPFSLTDARDLILSHPARASSHLSLFRLVEDKAPPLWQLNELGVALWLEPTNPYVRDLYALALLRMGRKQEGLEEVTRSVFYSPSLSAHFYLGEAFPPWLSQKEKEAVEEGFKKALAFEYPGAMDGLASFYTRLGRFTDEGKLYEEVALRMKDPGAKAGHLLNAGLAYVKAGEGKKAEALFRQAALTIPQDSRSYHHLAILIFAARGDLNAAKAVVSEGIGNGADPLSLYFSLAEAAQKAGNREEEKSALLKVLDLRPSSSEAVFRLGLLYLQESSFDRAALYFSKAASINPSSAAAFYHLGLAEEGRYQFVAADKVYTRALELLPNNIDFQQRYEAFRRKVAQNQKPNGGERSK